MFGWVIVTVLLFFVTKPQSAVVIAVMGGFLFLPMATYDLPGISEYNKSAAIAIGLVIGGFISGNITNYPLRYRTWDIPMLSYCFFVPIATSLANHLGLYDGISSLISNYLTWGVFYLVGRRYFRNQDNVRFLVYSIAIAGLIYLPFVVWELRMSPRLHINLYGFFAHDWRQHLRYGGFRPIVFMQHGLMVSLWMAVVTMTTYWLWRMKKAIYVMGVPIGFLVLVLFISTILCKSANGWFFLSLSILLFHYYKKTSSTNILRIFLVIIPIYMIVRVSNIIPVESVRNFADLFFDNERVTSLAIRLRQEELFGGRALQRPFFGWGGYSRGWPVDPTTGEVLTRAVDSLWVIVLSRFGFVGLVSLFVGLGLGPWKIFKENALGNRYLRMGFNSFDSYITPEGIILGTTVLFFMIDSLLNGMINPIYILCAGASISYYEDVKNKQSKLNAYR